MRRDGGKAARTWELWLHVREQDRDTGQWRICWPAFTALVPRRVIEDDEERLELAADFALCANVMNEPPAARLMPDTDEDE